MARDGAWIICPYCEEKYAPDAASDNSDYEHDFHCDACGGICLLRAEISVDYVTRPKLPPIRVG